MKITLKIQGPANIEKYLQALAHAVLLAKIAYYIIHLLSGLVI